MQNIKALLVIITLSALFGCSNPADQYVGTWSNEAYGGDIKLVIKREDKKILFTVLTASTNRQLFMQSARVNEGYLVIDGDGIFEKFTYIKENDEITSIGGVDGIAPFKRTSM